MKKPIPILLLILAGLLVATVAVPVFAGHHEGKQAQLEKQKVQARPVHEIEGVVFTDADETRNLLVVGVVNLGLAKAVEQKLKQLGIPLSSVEIVKTEPIVFATSLRDYVRPLEGGLQIAFVDGGLAYYCTMGFNAVRPDANGVDVHGFMVNSHCTTEKFQVDGTDHYQPWLSPSSQLIGNEIADPPAFKNGECVKGKKCRYSDAAFDQLAGSVSATLCSIARPDDFNNGSLTLDTVDSSFNIVGELEGNAAMGTTLNKVGRTTGWTQGAVTMSCVDTGVQGGGNILLLCQDFVGAEVDGGDSGSPVFEIVPGTNDVTLNGILWGGASDGSYFVYSPISNIETDLGHLTTYVAGGTPTPTPTPGPTPTPTPTPTPGPTPPPPPPGSEYMGVSDIEWNSKKRNLDFIVNIRWDSDGNGALSSADSPVSAAHVNATLIHDKNDDGVYVCGAPDSCWNNFGGNTGSNGKIKFSLIGGAPSGPYQAEVTGLTHSTYTWKKALDADSPSCFDRGGSNAEFLPCP